MMGVFAQLASVLAISTVYVRFGLSVNPFD